MSISNGSKPLALLIPGLDGTGHLFYRQVETLSARYRVKAWEYHRRSRFGFQDLVRELGEGTSQEERGSILVVGESFGGTVAMHYVLAFPERVGSLVLINTFASYRHRTRIRVACLLAPTLRWRGARAIKSSIVDRTLAQEGIPQEDRRRYHEIIQMVDVDAYRQRLELVRDVDLRPRLEEIKVPTFVFASGRDKIVPSRAEGQLLAAAIPKAELHEFPQAGHALLLTPGFALADYVFQ